MSFSHPLLGSGLRSCLAMLAENGADIPLTHYPKISFLTAAIAGGIPIRAYERLRYGAAIRQQKIRAPIFILGYYRSGTTFLHYLLGADPQFAFPETYQVMLPNIFLSGGDSFRGIIQKALPETRPMDNIRMGSALPKEEEFALLNINGASLAKGYVFPKKLIEYHQRFVMFENSTDELLWKQGVDFFLKKISYSNQGKTLVVKTPANTARIKQLLELYPDARFVHISRNPEVVYHSNMKMLRKIVEMMALTHYDDKDLSDFLLHSYSTTYQRYFETKTLIPSGQLVELRYKFLIQNPLTELERVYKVLQFKDFEKARPFFESELRHYSNYETNTFKLDPETHNLLKMKWRQPFEEFGD